MLMGIYLLIIGLVDLKFRDKYTQEANIWMSSWFCVFLGMLAMISSEVSVLILSFMSIERFLLIAAPLRRQQRMLTASTAKFSMIIIWIIGIIIASLPGKFISTNISIILLLLNYLFNSYTLEKQHKVLWSQWYVFSSTY